MMIEEHGGSCCGVSHLWDFGPCNDRALRELDRILASYSNTRDVYEEIDDGYGRHRQTKFGHLLEVTLTDDQMEDWAQELKKRKFKLCDRWKNDNSGNAVNLLTWKTKNSRKKLPYTW